MPSARRIKDGLAVVLLVGFGVLLLAAPLFEGGLLLPVLGVFMLGLAYVVAQVRLVGRDGRARTSLEHGPGGPALVVALRSTTPRVMIAVGLVGSLVSLTAVIGVGVGDGGLLFLPFLLLFAVLVPDAVRALRLRPRLELSTRTVIYRGWSLDSELAWTDIASVRIDAGYRPRLVVDGHAGSASWRVRRHRWILALEPSPGQPEIAVFTLSLDEPERLRTLIDSLRRLTDAQRAPLIADEGVTYLAGGR